MSGIMETSLSCLNESRLKNANLHQEYNECKNQPADFTLTSLPFWDILVFQSNRRFIVTGYEYMLPTLKVVSLDNDEL